VYKLKMDFTKYPFGIPATVHNAEKTLFGLVTKHKKSVEYLMPVES